MLERRLGELPGDGEEEEDEQEAEDKEHAVGGVRRAETKKKSNSSNASGSEIEKNSSKDDDATNGENGGNANEDNNNDRNNEGAGIHKDAYNADSAGTEMAPGSGVGSTNSDTSFDQQFDIGDNAIWDSTAMGRGDVWEMPEPIYPQHHPVTDADTGMMDALIAQATTTMPAVSQIPSTAEFGNFLPTPPVELAMPRGLFSDLSQADLYVSLAYLTTSYYLFQVQSTITQCYFIPDHG